MVAVLSILWTLTLHSAIALHLFGGESIPAGIAKLRQRLDRCERLTRQLEAQEASATAAGAGDASVSAAAHLATLERRIAILQKQKDRHKAAA